MPFYTRNGSNNLNVKLPAPYSGSSANGYPTSTTQDTLYAVRTNYYTKGKRLYTCYGGKLYPPEIYLESWMDGGSPVLYIEVYNPNPIPVQCTLRYPQNGTTNMVTKTITLQSYQDTTIETVVTGYVYLYAYAKFSRATSQYNVNPSDEVYEQILSADRDDSTTT